MLSICPHIKPRGGISQILTFSYKDTPYSPWLCMEWEEIALYRLFNLTQPLTRAPENLKLAGKNGCCMRSLGLSKKPYICSFQTNYPHYHGFLMHLFGLLDLFGWHSPFLVAHFGWWTLISEAISTG